MAYKAVYNGFFPQVSGTLQYIYSEPATLGNASRYRAGISGSQNIFRGGEDLILTRQARTAQWIESSDLESILVDLYAELISAYADHAYAQELRHLSETIISRREGNLDLVRLQYQGGRENKSSVALAQAYLANAKYSLFQAENILEVNKALFSRTIGLEESKLPPVVSAPTHWPSLDISEAAWSEEHPRLRIARYRLRLAELEISRARAQFLPRLDFDASYGLSDVSFFPSNEAWNLGLQLSVPLFVGGRNYYTLKKAQHDRQEQTWTLQNIFNELKLEIRVASRDLREAELKLEVDQKFEAAAKMRAEIARIRYNNGLVSFDNWDIIENDLIARQTALLQSQRSLLVRKANLVKALGRHGF